MPAFLPTIEIGAVVQQDMLDALLELLDEGLAASIENESPLTKSLVMLGEFFERNAVFREFLRIAYEPPDQVFRWDL